MKDNRIITVMAPVTDEFLNGLDDAFKQMSMAAADQMIKNPIKFGESMTTRGYVDIDGRFFKMMLKFRAKPFDILRQQVDEIDENDYHAGILKEKTRPNAVTEWKSGTS